MIFHPEEYRCATEYWQNKPFPNITPEQKTLINQRGKDLIKFHLEHPGLHHFISCMVFVIIFSLDWWVLLYLGGYIRSWVLSGIAVGLAHAIVMYSLTVFSLHEGAAHKLIVLRRGAISRFISFLANNASRITLTENDYYAKNHLSHHANFTTPKDDEFLNFVFARRFYSALIPFALVFNFSDFKTYSGMKYTPSRILALVLTFGYHFIFALVMLQKYNWGMIFIALVLVFPNVSFWLDRVRQNTEHNLMPLSTVDGARDLGVDFWGILIGGGPWGQPCHWSHHLYPGIPWYQQLRLHAYIATILTPEQKKFFFIDPVIGFPKKVALILKHTASH